MTAATHKFANRSGYVGGCRCDECKAAETRYRRHYRAGGTPLKFPCWFCHEHFTTDLGRAQHQGRMHG